MSARHPDLDEANLTPEQHTVYDAIKSGPRGVVQGPLRVWLQSPGLADRAQALGAFCRYDTTLPPKLSELAILVMGAHWQAGFEWAVHLPIALKAGVDPTAAEAIRKGETPVFADAGQAAIYTFASELLRDRRVSDATYTTAHRLFGTRVLVDLVGILGYYTLISMTICAFDVPLPGGTPDPFADRPERLANPA